MLLAGAGCGKKESPVKAPVAQPVPQKKEIPQKKESQAPARLALIHAWSGADGSALLRLCVWIKPGQLAGAPDQVEFWKASNRWASAYERLGRELPVLKTGAVETLYRVDPGANLAAGEKLKAVVRWGTNRVESGPVIIDAPPTGTVDRLQCEFDRAMLAGDYTTALGVSSNRIRLDDKAYEGYWMEGLAWEGLTNRASAQQAYRRALERYPQSTRDSFREPPVVLIQKLRNLNR